MAAEQLQRVATHPLVVGEAFVHQYYHILFHSPELVHRFYQDCSKLGRPDGSGTLTTISTMKAINEKILASDSSKFQSKIQTIDAQESYKGGVLILVTGHLTGQNNLKRTFAQTFFLAPQEKGYFVLNDIFRYTETTEHEQQSPTVDTQESYNGGVLMLLTGHLTDQDNTKKSFMQTFFLAPQERGYSFLNDIFRGTDKSDQAEQQQAKNDSTAVPESHEHVFLQPQVQENHDQTAPSDVVVDKSNAKAEEEPAAAKEEPVVIDKSLNNSETDVESKTAKAPKKSYASIVKVLRENAVPSSVFIASPARPAATSPPEAQASEDHIPPAAENTDVRESEADASSVYIKNLPLNATPAQLEEEFKRFGPIKAGGVQVRSNKQQGFCFGFVEFEVASAVQQAIEASPVLIGGRQAYVEEKRPSGSRFTSRGRHVPARGGFRDGARGRGGYYSNGRGYGRGDFGGWSGGGRGGGGYHHHRTDGAAASGGRTAASPTVANGLSGNPSSPSSSFKEVAPGVSASA